MSATLALLFAATAVLPSTRGVVARGVVVYLECPSLEIPADTVSRAVRAQMSDLHVPLQQVRLPQCVDSVVEQLRIADATYHATAVAVFWFEMTPPEGAALNLYDPRGGRLLVHRIAAQPSELAGALEAAAIVLRAAVQALIRGEEVVDESFEVADVVVPPPVDPAGVVDDAAPATSVQSARWHVGLAYAATAYASDRLPTQGAVAEVGRRVGSGGQLVVGYELRRRTIVRTPDVGTRLQHHPTSLGLRWIVVRTAMRVSVGGHAGVDYVTQSSWARGSVPASEGRQARTRWFVRPEVALGTALGQSFDLFARGGLDIAIDSTRYVIGTPSGPQVLLAPWRVQPIVTLGVNVTFW